METQLYKSPSIKRRADVSSKVFCFPFLVRKVFLERIILQFLFSFIFVFYQRGIFSFLLFQSQIKNERA